MFSFLYFLENILFWAMVAAVVYLFVQNKKIKQRIGALESLDPAEGLIQSNPPEDPVQAKIATPSPAVSAQPNDDDKAVKKAAAMRAKAELTGKKVTQSSPAPGKPAATGPSVVENLFSWLTQNWFYAVAAVSLILAGVYLVQYGVENGLLSPRVRIFMALAMGASFLAIGEFVRRKFGDGKEASSAYLPSTFSGAGIVTLFAAIVAARGLYDLIGMEMCFIGLIVIAGLAIVFGWFYGPLLTAIGLLGAFAAPMLVGGNNTNPEWLFAYFALIAAIGLFVDAVHRWVWVSVLSMVGGYVTIVAFGITSGHDVSYILALLILPLMAVLIPVRSITPRHDGAMMSMQFTKMETLSTAVVPTWLAGVSLAVTSFALFVQSGNSQTEFWVAIAGLLALFLIWVVWSGTAKALSDQLVVPVIGILAAIIAEGFIQRSAYQVYEAVAADIEARSTAYDHTLLFAIGFVVFLALAARSLSTKTHRMPWVLAATILPAMIVGAIEFSWMPARITGNYNWALHLAVFAVSMMIFAERLARQDGADKQRASLAALSSMSTITLAFFVLLSSSALTISLAVAMLGAAYLDRRYVMPVLNLLIAVIVAIIGYRLVVDPGFDWALEGNLFMVALTFAFVIFAFVYARKLIDPAKRQSTAMLLETAVVGAVGIAINVALHRFVDAYLYKPSSGFTLFRDPVHMETSLSAMIWLTLAYVQITRIKMGGKLQIVRKILGGVMLVLGICLLLLSLSVLSPMVLGGHVFGPVIFNTVFVAYFIPAVAIAIGTARSDHVVTWVRYVLYALSVVLITAYGFFTIRHIWVGPELDGPMSQGEIYTYSAVLLVLGTGLLVAAIWKKSSLLRRAAMVIIIVTIAKVFLVDAAGLTGLVRVFSFLGLGLTLAALAWLNRWAVGVVQQEDA
ncbi:MAG: DUF2339 domain-containing protein [Halocynthiibacter sp.]